MILGGDEDVVATATPPRHHIMQQVMRVIAYTVSSPAGGGLRGFVRFGENTRLGQTRVCVAGPKKSDDFAAVLDFETREVSKVFVDANLPVDVARVHKTCWMIVDAFHKFVDTSSIRDLVSLSEACEQEKAEQEKAEQEEAKQVKNGTEWQLGWWRDRLGDDPSLTTFVAGVLPLQLTQLYGILGKTSLWTWVSGQRIQVDKARVRDATSESLDAVSQVLQEVHLWEYHDDLRAAIRVRLIDNTGTGNPLLPWIAAIRLLCGVHGCDEVVHTWFITRWLAEITKQGQAHSPDPMATLRIALTNDVPPILPASIQLLIRRQTETTDSLVRIIAMLRAMFVDGLWATEELEKLADGADFTGELAVDDLAGVALGLQRAWDTAELSWSVFQKMILEHGLPVEWIGVDAREPFALRALTCARSWLIKHAAICKDGPSYASGVIQRGIWTPVNADFTGAVAATVADFRVANAAILRKCPLNHCRNGVYHRFATLEGVAYPILRLAPNYTTNTVKFTASLINTNGEHDLGLGISLGRTETYTGDRTTVESLARICLDSDWRFAASASASASAPGGGDITSVGLLWSAVGFGPWVTMNWSGTCNSPLPGVPREDTPFVVRTDLPEVRIFAVKEKQWMLAIGRDWYTLPQTVAVPDGTLTLQSLLMDWFTGATKEELVVSPSCSVTIHDLGNFPFAAIIPNYGDVAPDIPDVPVVRGFVLSDLARALRERVVDPKFASNDNRLVVPERVGMQLKFTTPDSDSPSVNTDILSVTSRMMSRLLRVERDGVALGSITLEQRNTADLIMLEPVTSSSAGAGSGVEPVGTVSVHPFLIGGTPKITSNDVTFTTEETKIMPPVWTKDMFRALRAATKTVGTKPFTIDPLLALLMLGPRGAPNAGGVTPVSTDEFRVAVELAWNHCPLQVHWVSMRGELDLETIANIIGAIMNVTWKDTGGPSRKAILSRRFYGLYDGLFRKEFKNVSDILGDMPDELRDDSPIPAPSPLLTVSTKPLTVTPSPMLPAKPQASASWADLTKVRAQSRSVPPGGGSQGSVVSSRPGK